MGTVMRLGERVLEAHPVVSTGSLLLDGALGIGGLPKGRVVEVYGCVRPLCRRHHVRRFQLQKLNSCSFRRLALKPPKLCLHSGHGMRDGVSTGPSSPPRARYELVVVVHWWFVVLRVFHRAFTQQCHN